MSALAERIADWLIVNGTITEEDKEIYAYAIYSLILLSVPITLVSVYEAIWGNIRGCVILMITFLLIRRFCGGYHMDNPFLCMAFSGLTIILVVRLGTVNYTGRGLNYCLIIAFLILMINDPVDTPNRRLDQEEKKRCKRMVIRACCISLLSIILLHNRNMILECRYVILGVIMAAVLQEMGLVKNRYNEKKHRVYP